MLKVAPTGWHQCGFERSRPLVVGLCESPHLVGGQAKFAERSPEQLAAVDDIQEPITVRGSRVSVRGKVLEQATTKTRPGPRRVPLSDAAVAALLSWQPRQAEEAEAAQDAWRTEGHVFTMEDGRGLDPTYVTRTFSFLRREGRNVRRFVSTVFGTVPRR